MKKILRIMWSEVKRNKLCVTTFIICLISSMPYLFNNNQLYIGRMVVYAISMTIYLCTLFKPKFVYKYFKDCS